jgi:hypothetical protein
MIRASRVAVKTGLVLTVLSLIACFVACGGVSNDLVGDGADGGSEADASTRDAGNRRDSESVQDATTPGDSGAATKTGIVAAISTYFTASMNLEASFDDPSRDGTPLPSLVLGGCKATLAGAIPTPSAWPESGDIVFTSSSDAGVLDQALAPGTDGQYTSQTATLDVTGNEPLHVASTGGKDVPAFETDLNFPLALLASDSLVNATTFDSSADLTVALQRGEKDLDFYFSLTGTNGTATTYADSIVCFLPSETGSVVVPQAILSYVPKGSYTFSAYSAQVEVVEVGGYSVSIDAVGPVANAAKTKAAGGVTVTLQ